MPPGTQWTLSMIVLATLDTLLLVLDFLDVPSIVRLGMVNKVLYKEIKGNTVIWLRALRALQRDECLMPFTHLITDHKIDGDQQQQQQQQQQHDSRHSACLPYRFASAILGKGTVSSVTRIFHLDTAGQGPPPQYAMYPVPGGRWIFHTDRGTNVNSSREPARISCSDLNGASTMRTFPLRFRVDTWPTIFGIQSDPDNFRTVVLVSYQLTFPARCVEVLHATWLSGGKPDDMPTWSRAAHIVVDIAEQVRSMVLEGQYVVVPLSYSLIIWQWRMGEWATLTFGPRKIRGAWLAPPLLYVLDDSSNTLQVLDIPELSPVVNGLLAEFIIIIPSSSPRYVFSWKDGPRRSCELSILAIWRPLDRRAHKLVTIIHWDSNDFGMTLLDFSDPHHLGIVKEWHGGGGGGGGGRNNPNDTSHPICSGVLHTVHVRGMVIRAGRRFITRLEKGGRRRDDDDDDSSSSLEPELRILGYSLMSEIPSTLSVPVKVPNEEWDQAEAYDTCTIFGRIILRQYDGGSDSEYSDSQSASSLVLVDFV